ncbi:hypothetical protein J2S35_001344 [Falsarthrobacter nasiphocae]|uniref:Uncharacterized protein n=1 Tax=Falsarthrobacter nasiphocae TaxID=189863 RepID=A0AAE4C7C2_9MICC|nr:hypothetical protein [Falsarthrobacter nasiphocae]
MKNVGLIVVLILGLATLILRSTGIIEEGTSNVVFLALIVVSTVLGVWRAKSDRRS